MANKSKIIVTFFKGNKAFLRQSIKLNSWNERKYGPMNKNGGSSWFNAGWDYGAKWAQNKKESKVYFSHNFFRLDNVTMVKSTQRKKNFKRVEC